MNNKEITRKVARYIEAEGAERIPPSVIDQAKYCLLEHLGACLIGSSTLMSRLTFNLVKSLFPAGNCPLIGTDFQSNVLGAIWGNGVSASSWDYDDGHRLPLRKVPITQALGHAAGHPGSVVIPSALAFAFDKSATGLKLLESIVVGYEVGVRIASSRRPHTVLANATGNWGVFAAAVSAAKILELPARTIENLLGVAAANLINPPGRVVLQNMGMIKESIGWSGVTGAASCLMAQSGITGLAEILDNEKFFDETFFEDLRENYEIMKVYFKPYSSCRMSHPVIDAAISIRQDHGINVADIKRIVVKTSLKALAMNNCEPRTIEEAQYSIPFCVATALKHGKVSPSVMQDCDLRDPTIHHLCAKVQIVQDEKQNRNQQEEALFPRKTAGGITVITEGETFSAYSDCPKGDPENPIGRGQLIEKFLESSQTKLSQKIAQEILSFVLSIEEHKDLAALRSVLTARQS